MQMRRGEILAVIGPNGAGKTSLFNSLTGVYTPQEGAITLVGQARATQPVSVIGKKTHVVNHLGVARTFQNIRLFPALTALENVKVGVETRQKAGPIAAMLGMPWQRREEKDEHRAAPPRCCATSGLLDKANELAGSLAYGEQRRLEIARALGTDPGVLLLDEPAAGTNPAEKRDLAELIARINAERGISVLLIEHDMKLVMSVAHRIVVLNFGSKIAEGTPQRDPARPGRRSRPTSARPTEEAEQQAEEQPELHLIDTTADARRDRSPAASTGRAGRPPGRDRLAGLRVADGRRHRGPLRRDPGPQGLSFHVNEGEIVALLGANGAGKTTTQKTVSGMLRPTLGSITYDGERIDGIPAHELIGLGHLPRPRGPARVPADVGGGEPRDGRVPVQAAPTRTTSSGCSSCSRVLKERLKQTAGTLSGGEQQMLAIGRALMGKPRLILLDEPSMGLAPMIVAQIFEIIARDQPAGRHRAARRAERGAGPGAGRSRLRPRDRRDRAAGHRPRAAGRRPRSRGVPRRGDRRVLASGAGTAECVA